MAGATGGAERAPPSFHRARAPPTSALQTSATPDTGAADIGAADIGAADIGAADMGAADIGAADIGAAEPGAPRRARPRPAPASPPATPPRPRPPDAGLAVARSSLETNSSIRELSRAEVRLGVLAPGLEDLDRARLEALELLGDGVLHLGVLGQERLDGVLVAL
ncbi:MAG: hypothetical protein R3F43_05970 [bacterium]